LDNVNNTSDANKPVSTAQQDALNAKVTGNTAIVAATKTKITYDAKGLVTAGDILDAADMPMAIDAANIGAGVVSSTEFGYLDGVTSAIQTQLNAKQATLVSATNIKTINSTSLLGSGDISISASPSGVAGAIQFSNGSAFASDAANLFWDDTNNRLGVGTNSPTSTIQIKGSGTTSATTSLLVQDSGGTEILSLKNNGSLVAKLVVNSNGFSANSGGYLQIASRLNIKSPSDGIATFLNDAETSFNRLQLGGTTSSFPSIKRNGTAIDFRLADDSAFAPINAGATTLRGSGSTSATTSLLVQNSAGTAALTVKDDLTTTFGGNVTTPSLTINGNWIANNSNTIFGTSFNYILNPVNIGGTLQTSSAMLEVRSTTRGFLPPVMTTTQRNAIASPAAGLMIYNTTTAKLNVYTTAWEAITSI
jgi:hypothetical protein